MPSYGEDGGEEPEIAGAYIVDDEGHPRRVGMAMSNEFSDHVIEKKSYLYLAPSKLRTCSLGPELVLEPDFSAVRGVVAVERGGEKSGRTQAIATGDANMCHALANLEDHHFKYEAHRRPGDAHIHSSGPTRSASGAVSSSRTET